MPPGVGTSQKCRVISSNKRSGDGMYFRSAGSLASEDFPYIPARQLSELQANKSSSILHSRNKRCPGATPRWVCFLGVYHKATLYYRNLLLLTGHLQPNLGTIHTCVPNYAMLRCTRAPARQPGKSGRRPIMNVQDIEASAMTGRSESSKLRVLSFALNARGFIKAPWLD